MNNEPSITKTELKKILINRLTGYELREDLLDLCFPPPKPRTFYIELDSQDLPCGCETSLNDYLEVSKGHTIIKVIEVIK